MNVTTALRALADHLDRHPQLLNNRSLSIWLTRYEFEVHGFAVDTIQHLLRWHDALAAPSLTAVVHGEAVHLRVHGLAADQPVQFVMIAKNTVADLLRGNFALTDQPTVVPVHRLRALVDASVAEGIERPIVDPALIGGAS